MLVTENVFSGISGAKTAKTESVEPEYANMVEILPGRGVATEAGIEANITFRDAMNHNTTGTTRAANFANFRANDRVRVVKETLGTEQYLGRIGLVALPASIPRGKEEGFSFVLLERKGKEKPVSFWFKNDNLELVFDSEFSDEVYSESELKPELEVGLEPEPELEPESRAEPELRAEQKSESEPDSSIPTLIPDVVEELSFDEEVDRQRLENTVKSAFYEAGCALRELRDRRLYRNTHKTFERYCRDVFDYNRHSANFKIAAAVVFENLATNGSQILPTSERQLRELSALEPNEQCLVWSTAVSESGDKVPSGRTVKSIIKRLNQKKVSEPDNATQRPIPYAVGNVVEIRAGSNPDLRKHDGMWGIVTHVGSFSCTVHVSLRNVNLQCKPDEMDIVDEKHTADIRAVSERIKILINHANLAATAYGMLEVLSRQTCFSEDDLWLLEKIEERYNKKR